jgi:hypothetical protein
VARTRSRVVFLPGIAHGTLGCRTARAAVSSRTSSAADGLEMESGEQVSVQQLAGVLRTFGVSQPAIARAIELGGSQAGIAEIIPARGAAARTVGAAQIEASGGMPVERTRMAPG